MSNYTFHALHIESVLPFPAKAYLQDHKQPPQKFKHVYSHIYIIKTKKVTWFQGKQGAQSPLTHFQNTYSSFTSFHPTLIKNNHCKQQIYVIIQQ